MAWHFSSRPKQKSWRNDGFSQRTSRLPMASPQLSKLTTMYICVYLYVNIYIYMLVPQHPAGTSLLHLAMRPKSLRNLSWSHERNGVEKESVRLTWRSWQGFRWIHFGSTANNIGSGAGPLKPAIWNSLKSQEGQRAQHPCPPELLLLRALEGFATFLASRRTTKSTVDGSSGCQTSSRLSTSCSPMPVGPICLRAF